MTSDMTGLPPSTIARLSARAVVQDIAVRVVSLPPELNRTPAPLKLQGTVSGQGPDGSVQIETDRGVVSLMLRDRQGLPPGQQVEIDLPAGSPAQQASLRPAPPRQQTQATPPPPPSLNGQLSTVSAEEKSLRLDRAASVRATEIEQALKEAAPRIADLLAAKNPGAPLQAGQLVRLIPLPPGEAEPLPLQPGQLVTPLPEGELLQALAGVLESLPEEVASPLKLALTSLLGRMDLSALEKQGGAQGQKPTLPQTLQNLIQPSDNTQKNNTIRYEPIGLFNPAKPLDVQVQAVVTVPVRPGSAPVTGPGQVLVVQGVVGQSPPQSGGGIDKPPPQILPGQVVGFTRQNLPVLAVSVPTLGFSQTYVLQFQASNLSPGSPVLMSLLPEAATNGTAVQTMGTPLSTWVQGGVWETLTELVQTLHQINPAVAHQMTQMLPATTQPQSLGALALLFLSVMRSGDLEGWMPPPVLNLLRQSGKTDLLRSVVADLAMGTRAESLALPQDWRVTVLPFYLNQQVHKLPLYFKQTEEDETDQGRERRRKTLRFLFDLKLTRMGQVQVDGFMQPERLDMILRTRTPLSVPMQSRMKGLYVGAMEKSNLRGELSFQFRPEQWVSLEDSLLTA